MVLYAYSYEYSYPSVLRLWVSVGIVLYQYNHACNSNKFLAIRHPSKEGDSLRALTPFFWKGTESVCLSVRNFGLVRTYDTSGRRDGAGGA